MVRRGRTVHCDDHGAHGTRPGQQRNRDRHHGDTRPGRRTALLLSRGSHPVDLCLQHRQRHQKQHNATTHPKRPQAGPEPMQQGFAKQCHQYQYRGDREGRRPGHAVAFSGAVAIGQRQQDRDRHERVQDHQQRREKARIFRPVFQWAHGFRQHHVDGAIMAPLERKGQRQPPKQNHDSAGFG